MGEIRARLIQEIGTRAFLRVFTYSNEHACPATKGDGCDARLHLADAPTTEDHVIGGDVADHPVESWPTTCSACSLPFPASATRQVLRKRLFDTASGEPEIGDLFWVTYEHWLSDVTSYYTSAKDVRPCQPTRCIARWTNCDGRHLHAILPNGHEWNVMGRASNCGLPDDQEHRCWVMTGELPRVTVGKGGKTCPAGVGSIAAPAVGGSPAWHGFLVDGVFRRC